MYVLILQQGNSTNKNLQQLTVTVNVPVRTENNSLAYYQAY